MSFIFRILINLWFNQVPAEQRPVFLETAGSVRDALNGFLSEHGK